MAAQLRSKMRHRQRTCVSLNYRWASVRLRHRNEKDKRLGGDNTQQTETQEFKGFKRIQNELLGRTMLTHTKQTELRRGVSHTEMVMHECPRTE